MPAEPTEERAEIADVATTLSTMAPDEHGTTPQLRILDVVAAILESGGADAVQLQEVARQARVSLATVYKHFGSRDELIAAAVAHWMDVNVYRHLSEVDPGGPLDQALLDHYKRIFQPWERSPRMAEAFVRAQMGPADDRLADQGFAAAEPIVRSFFEGTDPEWADDIMTILHNVAYALFVRFAAGEIAVTEILPTLERTVHRVVGAPGAGTGADDSSGDRPATGSPRLTQR